MIQRPVISVAMCTYNGERYLSEQLESIAEQTLLPDELVVCDDESTDATLEILEAFSRKADFPVRIDRNAKKLGVTRNFEKALSLCRGRYIFLADQDDIWLKNKIRSLIDIIGRHEINGDTVRPALVFSDLEVVDANLKLLRPSFFRSMGFHSGMLAFPSLLMENAVTGCASVMNRKLLDFVLPIPGDVEIIGMHDWWIALCAAATVDIVYHETALAKYRQHSSNAVGAASARAKQPKLTSHGGTGSIIPRGERALRKIDRAMRRAQIVWHRIESRDSGALSVGSAAERYARFESLYFWERLRLLSHHPIWRRTLLKSIRLSLRMLYWKIERNGRVV